MCGDGRAAGTVGHRGEGAEAARDGVIAELQSGLQSQNLLRVPVVGAGRTRRVVGWASAIAAVTVPSAAATQARDSCRSGSNSTMTGCGFASSWVKASRAAATSPSLASASTRPVRHAFW